jgi:hypothetical protein
MCVCVRARVCVCLRICGPRAELNIRRVNRDRFLLQCGSCCAQRNTGRLMCHLRCQIGAEPKQNTLTGGGGTAHTHTHIHTERHTHTHITHLHATLTRTIIHTQTHKRARTHTQRHTRFLFLSIFPFVCLLSYSSSLFLSHTQENVTDLMGFQGKYTGSESCNRDTKYSFIRCVKQ